MKVIFVCCFHNRTVCFHVDHQDISSHSSLVCVDVDQGKTLSVTIMCYSRLSLRGVYLLM